MIDQVKEETKGKMLFLFRFIGRVAGTGGHIISFAFEFSNYIVNIFVWREGKIEAQVERGGESVIKTALPEYFGGF